MVNEDGPDLASTLLALTEGATDGATDGVTSAEPTTDGAGPDESDPSGDVEGGDEHPVLHVPVKKKGSRKR